MLSTFGNFIKQGHWLTNWYPSPRVEVQGHLNWYLCELLASAIILQIILFIQVYLVINQNNWIAFLLKAAQAYTQLSAKYILDITSLYVLVDVCDKELI